MGRVKKTRMKRSGNLEPMMSHYKKKTKEELQAVRNQRDGAGPAQRYDTQTPGEARPNKKKRKEIIIDVWLAFNICIYV